MIKGCMKTLSLLIIHVSFLACPATAQTYYLPKTVVRMHLTLEKQTYTPGDFARYAERYLRLQDIQQQEQVSHRVISCDLSAFGVRDTSKCFVLHLKGKGETADVKLSDDGVLLAINAEPINGSGEGSLIRRGTRSENLPQVRQAREYLSAEVLAAGSTAKMAELTAQQMVELRERRQLLATGEADEMPQDEQQLQLMLDRIDQEHAALMTLLTGTIRRDTTQHTVILYPEKEVERDVAFRISRRLGLVDKDDLAGVPYYITIKNLYPTDVPVPENKKGEDIYVSVPGMAQITLEQEDLPLATFNTSLAQFGHLELRSGSIFKRNNTHLQLHPATGAVVSLRTDQD